MMTSGFRLASIHTQHLCCFGSTTLNGIQQSADNSKTKDSTTRLNGEDNKSKRLRNALTNTLTSLAPKVATGNKTLQAVISTVCILYGLCVNSRPTSPRLMLSI